MSCWTQNWCFRTLTIQPMEQWVYYLYSSVNMGTELSAICGIPYPLHYITLMRSTWMVILDNNVMLLAFFVTNVIPDSIFAPISPVGAMEEIMVAVYLKTYRPVLIPIQILLPTQIQIQIQAQI